MMDKLHILGEVKFVINMLPRASFPFLIINIKWANELSNLNCKVEIRICYAILGLQLNPREQSETNKFK